MQSPIPLIPFLLSFILADTPPPPSGNGFDPWSLLERWGIAFVMGVIAYLLWKRSEVTRADLEKERLEVQKELLKSHKDNAADMRGLIVENMKVSQTVATALEGLTNKVHGIPCRQNPGKHE